MANEIQRIYRGSQASPGTSEAGTFTLTFNGQTTTDLTHNATAASVVSALEALSNIGVGDVDVTENADGWTVTFQGALANTNVAQMTVNSSLKQDASTVNVQVTQTGSSGVQQHIVVVTLSDSPTEGEFSLSAAAFPWTGAICSPVAYNVSAATLEAALDGNGSPYPSSVSGSDGGPWTITSDNQIDDPTITGTENAGSPLRKSLGMEVVTTQQGSAVATTAKNRMMMGVG